METEIFERDRVEVRFCDFFLKWGEQERRGYKEKCKTRETMVAGGFIGDLVFSLCDGLSRVLAVGFGDRPHLVSRTTWITFAQVKWIILDKIKVV